MITLTKTMLLYLIFLVVTSLDMGSAGEEPTTTATATVTATAAIDSPAPSFRRLLKLNLPEWKEACVGCLRAVLSGAVAPFYAFFLGSMVSVHFLHDHEEMKKKITTYSLCFLAFCLISMLVNLSQHYHFPVMGENLTKRVREMMFSKILTFEVGWFDQEDNSTGAINLLQTS